MRRFSIRKRLLFLTVTLSIFFGLIISAIVFFFLQDSLIQDKIESAKELAAEQAQQSVGVLNGYKIFTKMLGTRTRVREFLQDQSSARQTELNNIFLEYIDDDHNLLSIYLMDRDGVALISTDQTFVGQNYSFRDYFKKAFLGSPFVEAALGKTSGKFGFYFSYPVKDGAGLVIGVLTVKVDEEAFSKNILESQLINSNNVMLTDDYGVVMFSNILERNLQSLGPLTADEAKQLKESNRFLGQEISYLPYVAARDLIVKYTSPILTVIQDYTDSKKEFFYVHKLDDLPFYLVVEIGMEDAKVAIFKTVMIVAGVIFVFVLLLTAAVYGLITKYLILPLGKLSEFAQKVSEGDLNYRLNIKTNDELEELSVVLNQMSEKLNKYYDDLDGQVKIKTLELEEKTKNMKEQQLAILNILDDVEVEKQRSENLAKDLVKFKMAVDNVSDHIVITDKEGMVLYGNKAAEKITGYPIREALGKKAGTLWKLPMPEAVYKKMWDTIKEKKKVFISEIQNKRKNGEVYDVAISISPVLDEKKQVVFFVGIERDITKEKMIDRAKTEFVSLASHQLRTPLSTINWYAEMLLSGDAGKVTSKQAKFLKEIYKGNQRMVELVNALLNVSRIELGTFAVEPQPTNLCEVLASVLLEVDPQIKNKKLKVTKNCPGNFPEMMVDPKLMRIIFQNFITNSIKYTPPEGKIVVTVTKQSKDVLISVSDTGYGIPKNAQDKIFNKLFRADNIRAIESDGTGLGLYIVKAIVEQSKGKIWFESEENKGTTFFATLPLKGMVKKEGAKDLA